MSSVTRVAAIVAFCLVVVSIAGLQVAARRPASKVPRFSDLCAFVMRYQVGRLPVGRLAVFGFWWWVGWHFLAR